MQIGRKKWGEGSFEILKETGHYRRDKKSIWAAELKKPNRMIHVLNEDKSFNEDRRAHK